MAHTVCRQFGLVKRVNIRSLIFETLSFCLTKSLGFFSLEKVEKFALLSWSRFPMRNASCMLNSCLYNSVERICEQIEKQTSFSLSQSLCLSRRANTARNHLQIYSPIDIKFSLHKQNIRKRKKSLFYLFLFILTFLNPKTIPHVNLSIFLLIVIYVPIHGNRRKLSFLLFR